MMITGEIRSKTVDLSCSIIIRAYNEETHIGRLLDGIAQQSIEGLEVILVDSGSTDNTVLIATSYQRTLPIRVLHIQPTEFTFGRSLNLGISNAQADLIVIASAHVYPVYPDWLERLLAPLSDPQVALSYGKQRGAENSHFSERQIFNHWYPDQSQPRQNHPFCNNANAAIQRSRWIEHPYDENLSGLEDLEWAHWAIHQGYAISYVAEAEIIHVHNESPRAVYNRYLREAMAFKRIFPQETFRITDLIHLVVTNIANDIRHAIKKNPSTNETSPDNSNKGYLWHNLGSIFWFRWMQFWGTYQGYRQSGPLTWQLRQTFYYPGPGSFGARGVNSSNQNQTSRNIEPIRYNQARPVMQVKSNDRSKAGPGSFGDRSNDRE